MMTALLTGFIYILFIFRPITLKSGRFSVAPVKTSQRNYSIHNRDNGIPTRTIDLPRGTPLSFDGSVSFDGIPLSVEGRREVEQEKRGRKIAMKSFISYHYICILYVGISLTLGACLQGWI